MLSLLREMADDENGRIVVPQHFGMSKEEQSRRHHVELLIDAEHAEWTSEQESIARLTNTGYDLVNAIYARDNDKRKFLELLSRGVAYIDAANTAVTLTKPTPEVEHIAQTQSTRRFDIMTKLWHKKRRRVVAQFTTRGALGSGMFGTAFIDAIANTLSDFGNRLMADYVGLCSDVRADSAAVLWFEDELYKQVEHAGRILRDLAIQDPLLRSRYKVQAEKAIQDTVSQVTQDAGIVFGRMNLRIKPGQRTGTSVSENFVRDKRDYFISHAGEDRVECVRPLVEELEGRGHTVWYSEYELTLGDSLLRKIDEGLRSSRFGVVILSPSFFAKPWPQAELDGLATKAAVEDRKVILPIWHRLGHEEVAERSPLLGGLVGIETTRGIPTVVDAILAASGGTKQS